MAGTEPTTEQPSDSQMRDVGAAFRERFISQLKEDNFVLFFQPILPAASTAAEPPFREILVRYKEEEKDLLPPGSFLPILEEQGLLPLLDRWVVGKLLKWGRDLQATGRRMPHCSVNLSIDTVRRDLAFADYVIRGIQKMGAMPASITFEIMTTDALAHREAVARMIEPLRAAGVTFALSWFAGEESALELAPSLGISYIKIDGSLAAAIAREPREKARLATIVQRCRKLGIRTVCMLVEDPEILAHLRTIRVDYVQGFGVAKPRILED
jgi:EAL domain-containing protein (putative c-di-GMP-specific phosphodiesterase class I)